MANSVDPDQTATKGAVCSGSTLFASMLNSSVVRQLFAADDISRRHCLGALRVKNYVYNKYTMGLSAYIIMEIIHKL